MPENHRDGRFNGPDGLSLYFQYWTPQASPHAVLLVAHGAGEHSSRYQAFARFFVERGYAVAAYDHPGHGKSDGTYGHIDRFSQYLDGLSLFRERVREDFPGVPLVLVGHSMGGLISAAYVERHPEDFTACALSAPAIASDLEPGFIQIALIKAMSFITPTLGAMQLEATGISRDNAVVQQYIDDPLVNHGKFTARFVSELFNTMGQVQGEAKRISLPLLLMHGEADSMTAPSGSKLLFDTAASEDKTLKLYPGLYHEIFNEPERETVLGDLFEWCQRVTKTTANTF